MASIVSTVEQGEVVSAGGPQRPPEASGRVTHPIWSKVAVFLAIPVVACILSYFLVTSRFYEEHADSAWIKASSQTFLAHGTPCQVLIFGDSTAITGIDPHIIQQRTHLNTCNIAQTKAALVVLGTSALDRYLANNPRPQYLVLQFAAANFYRARSWADTTSYMEGGIALIRYYPLRTFLSMIPRHPDLLIGMMRYAYVSGPAHLLSNLHAAVSFQNSPETPIDVHFTRPTAAYSSCAQVEDIDPIFHKPDASFIAWLREHYGSMADHVIVDVAPDSSCDPHLRYLRKTLSGTDNTLQAYPFTLFNEGYEHYTGLGAQQVSEQIAAQIAGQRSSGKAPGHAAAMGVGVTGAGAIDQRATSGGAHQDAF